MSTTRSRQHWLVKIRTVLSTAGFKFPSNPSAAIQRGAAMDQDLMSPSQTAVRYRCPCCGARTLSSPATMELCPVCWWEDDGQEDGDASEVRLTVNGDLSLNDARNHYRQCGASHPRFIGYVRLPQDTEQ